MSSRTSCLLSILLIALQISFASTETRPLVSCAENIFPVDGAEEYNPLVLRWENTGNVDSVRVYYGTEPDPPFITTLLSGDSLLISPVYDTITRY